ncbi:hypothetical protein Lpp78_11037 [Lacticaseibacillus paracasei subsp. paracasei CNCM I-2877]|nr:hypothetical protein Lpp78_11037 [Lacticaseibacillus paracasei subsp. paracasei CNCM I-2877]
MAAQAKTHRLSRGIYHMTGDAFFLMQIILLSVQ